MTGHRTKLPKSYKLKNGKLVKQEAGSVSEKIRKRKSKRQKPVRRTV